MSLLSDMGTKIGAKFKELITLIDGKFDKTGGTITGKITCNGIETGTGIDQGVSFEGGKHCINNNDGGGNFNIRIGNHFTSGSTEAGFAHHIVYSQASGLLNFDSSTTTLNIGDTPIWRTVLQVTPTNVTVNGSNVLTETNGMTGTKTISTSAPSGGVDGDIWIQV